MRIDPLSVGWYLSALVVGRMLKLDRLSERENAENEQAASGIWNGRSSSIAETALHFSDFCGKP